MWNDINADKTILLDMDGVIADFSGHALKAHGRDPGLTDQNPGEWDLARIMGITTEQFWRPIDDEFFWRTVPVIPGAQAFYQALCALAPVTICTIPSYSSGCYKAKVDWLREFTGMENFQRIILCQDKSLLARPTTVLIDDSDRNVESFTTAGGAAVLVPRAWNTSSGVVRTVEQKYGSVFNYVLEELKLYWRD